MKLFLALFISSTLCAQPIDSLKAALRGSKSDSTAARLQMELANAYAYIHLDSALLYARKAERHASELSVLQLVTLYEQLGSLNALKGLDVLGLGYYLKRLNLIKVHHLSGDLSAAHLSLATTYGKLNYNTKAEEHFKAVLLEASAQRDSLMISEALSHEATYRFNLRHYSRALYLWKERLRYRPGLADDYNFLSGLGDLYQGAGLYSEAEAYYRRAIGKAEKLHEQAYLAILYDGFGLMQLNRSNLAEALGWFKKAGSIAGSMGMENESALINGHIAKTLAAHKQYDTALLYARRAESFYRRVDRMRELASMLELRSEILVALNDPQAAYRDLAEAKYLKEQLLNTQTQKKFSELNASVIEERARQENALKDEETRRQKLIRNFFAVIAGLIFIAGLFILKNYRTIARQKKEVEKQKHLVEENRQELIKSIHYARYLQEAILPSRAFINAQLPQNFIVYLPKDIVAGDFYWSDRQGSLSFIAAADSTGHGVPGALVSVVCYNALHRALHEFGISETGPLLGKARELVVETFDSNADNGQQVKDGMDISLLSIDHEGQRVCWSGANNSLCYISKGRLLEIKADKQPVGSTEHQKPFTTHVIPYEKGNTFYLFTDGLRDQFGGPQGKKFKHKAFSDLLLQHAHLPMSEQAAIITSAFESWKGTLDQVDDVCVIGIRV